MARSGAVVPTTSSLDRWGRNLEAPSASFCTLASSSTPEGFWWEYLWGTIVLVLCTGICLAGSSIFSRASNGLLVVLLVATFSIPFSAIFRNPFINPRRGVEFTGWSWDTFRGNLKPRLTKGAAGSQNPERETFQDLFGILFPATGGIFAYV
jgi:potassium/chloride transporter 9